MGGKGSGEWTRWSKQATVESTKRLDMTTLKQMGIVGQIKQGSLSWKNGAEPIGSVMFKSTENSLTLIYHHRRTDKADWESVEQHIALETTPCHFGGVRYWFICTGCSARTRILCGGGRYFLCRDCYGLSYRSQNARDYDRLRIRHHNLKEQITDRFGNIDRPKGMHLKTFRRLSNKCMLLKSQIDEMFFQMYLSR